MNFIIKTAVRTLLKSTGREKAAADARTVKQKYLRLAEQVNDTTGRKSVRVPPMRGVDDDMREWSYYMILEHNVIVNRSITEIVRALANDEEPAGQGAINPKTDVMPVDEAGPEQVDIFAQSVDDHIRIVEELPKLRGTRLKNHPVFGPFDAHRWNAMFSFHLSLHLNQVEYVVKAVNEG